MTSDELRSNRIGLNIISMNIGGPVNICTYIRTSENLAKGEDNLDQMDQISYQLHNFPINY